MNRKLFLLLSALFFALISIAGDIYEQIARNIREVNTRELAGLFDNTVEIIIDERDGYYSKAQAEIIVRNFLIKNRPSTFSLVHKGSPSDGLAYSLGLLTTEDGTQYRTYFLLKNKVNRQLIQQIKFELE